MQKEKSSVSKFIYTFLIVFIIWLGFTTTLDVYEVATGVLVSLILALLTNNIFSCCGLQVLMPHKIVYLIQYFFIFLIALLKANLDVARRVISPSLPINPGIVEFKTKLTNDFAKMILANSITLTPGTLSIDVIGDTFYVHWIDVTHEDPEGAYKEIAESFEKTLLKIYG